MEGNENDPLFDTERMRGARSRLAGNQSTATMAETGGGIGIPIPRAPGAGGHPTRVAFARD
jgi:hypothetical protein